ncbi:hypothetical protein LR48_Vigan252s003500 [Vigna angularis]|uniref:Uncharacterized protein n=1 Tax=Phaseolus angularis TaxID=3914 RepID=A0A0L9T6W9_PHAAN|nr:hypothetical protein LR48_Vigan252s003500 [Vigna angularis]
MVQGAQTRSGSWQLRVEGPSLSQYGVVRGRTRAEAGGHVTPGHGDEGGECRRCKKHGAGGTDKERLLAASGGRGTWMNRTYTGMRGIWRLYSSRINVFVGDVKRFDVFIDVSYCMIRRLKGSIDVGHCINRRLLQLVSLGSVIAPSSFASFVIEKVASFGSLMAFQPKIESGSLLSSIKIANENER